jgi:hypothetical protein
MAEYKNALVTYLDIVGFEELLNKREPDEILYLLKLMKQKGDAAYGLIDSENKFKCIAFSEAFSDHVIRQIEFDEAGIDVAFGYEIPTIGRIQFDLLTNSMDSTLVRGGVSKGLSFMDDEGFVFGPAMVQAYKLEQIAKHPRIVIDRSLLQELLKKDRPGWDYMLKRGEDGVYFVDYLGVMIRDTTAASAPFRNTERTRILNLHKSAAEEKLAELLAEKEESRKQKGLWLAHYHNDVVKRLMEKDQASADELKSFLIAEAKFIEPNM